VTADQAHNDGSSSARASLAAASDYSKSNAVG